MQFHKIFFKMMFKVFNLKLPNKEFYLLWNQIDIMLLSIISGI